MSTADSVITEPISPESLSTVRTSSTDARSCLPPQRTIAYTKELSLPGASPPRIRGADRHRGVRACQLYAPLARSFSAAGKPGTPSTKLIRPRVCQPLTRWSRPAAGRGHSPRRGPATARQARLTPTRPAQHGRRQRRGAVPSAGAARQPPVKRGPRRPGPHSTDARQRRGTVPSLVLALAGRLGGHGGLGGLARTTVRGGRRAAAQGRALTR